MNNYEIFKKIIMEGRYDNTYKLAWAKSLVELCSECDVTENVEFYKITLSQIAKKFIKYYWDQIIIYDLLQSANTINQPIIVKIIKDLCNEINLTIDDYSRKKYLKIEKLLNNESINKVYTKSVNKIVGLLKKDVSWRFLILNNKEYKEIYIYEKNDDELSLDLELVKIIRDNNAKLYPLIDYRWIYLISDFNSNKKIHKKIIVESEEDVFNDKLFLNNNTPEAILETLKIVVEEEKIVVNVGEKFSELLGILKSINYDEIINDLEIQELKKWIEKNSSNKDPRFQEIIKKLKKILEDNVITESEKTEIIKITDQYYNLGKNFNNTSELVGIIEGIVSDNEINLKEVENLKKWMENNRQLSGTYFYDRLDIVIKAILNDGILDEKEKNELRILLTFLLKDNSLNQKISTLKNKIKNNQIIGNDLIDLIDDNSIILKIHREAIQQLKVLISKNCSVFDIDSEIIFLSLTLIALLKYDSNYYNYVEEVYEELYKTYNSQRIEGQIRNVIRKYYENNETRIITYVLENAIVPIYYLPSYFDFIYDIYKHNFDEYIDSNTDLSAEFAFVFEGIRKNLNYETDDLKLNVTNKTYSLIKTTKNLIQDDSKVYALIDLSVKIVKIIDEYKWNNPTLTLNNEYFKSGFEEWKNRNADEVKNKKDRLLTSKWEPHFVLQQDDIYLYIPEHKIKNTYDYSKLKLTVLSDNNIIYENTYPEVYEIIGGYKIVCENVLVENPLNNIRYTLYCGDELIYDSKERLYRKYIVFDSLGNELKNNKDYSGICLICTKENEIMNAQVRAKKSNYNILFMNVNTGDYITIESDLFNFSTLLKPGLIGQSNGVIYQVLNDSFEIYNKLDGIVYETTVPENKVYIVINGERDSIANHSLEKKKRGLYYNYLLHLNLPNNRYKIAIEEQENENYNRKKEFNFIIDDTFKSEVDLLSENELLVKIHSNLNSDEEIAVSLSDDDPNYISFDKHNYIIPLNKFMYKLGELNWTIYRDYNSDYIWIGDINSSTKLLLNGAQINKIEVLNNKGKLLSTIYPKIIEHGYNEIQAYLLKSYYEENYVILAFYVNDIKIGLMKLFCKSMVLKNETRFTYDTENDALLCDVKYIGKNLKLEMIDDEKNIVYSKEEISSGEAFEINNLKPFTNYYIRILKPAEGFTLDGDEQLYYKKIRFYTPDSLVGQKVYISSVEFYQKNQGIFTKKNMNLKRTFLKIDERIDDNIYTGRVLYRRDDGFKVPKNINPVEIEFNSDINGGTVETWITNEGDGLLMNFEEKTILNNMDDPKAVVIEKYYLKIERDGNE